MGNTMKKPIARFRLAVLCLCAAAVLSGCSLSSLFERTINLNLDAFPDLDSTYDIRIQSYKYDAASGRYEIADKFDVDGVSPGDNVRKTITVGADCKYIGVYLWDKTLGDWRYFMDFDVASVKNDVANVVYWLDYQKYFFNSAEVFGISSKKKQILSVGDTLITDFSKAPYFLVQVNSAKGKSFNVRIGNPSLYDEFYTGTTVESFNTGVGKATLIGSDYGALYRVERWAHDEFNVVLTLSSPQEESPTSIQVLDVTKMISHTFMAKKAITPDDGQSFYFSATWRYPERVPEPLKEHKVKKWVAATGEVTDVMSFDSLISGFVQHGSMIFATSGTELWSLDTATDTSRLCWVAPGYIVSLSVAGDYLLVSCGSNAWHMYNLLKIGDFQSLSTRSMCWGSQESVYMPSQNRVYLNRDDISPNTLCYLEFDPSTEKITDYQSCEETRDFSIYGILRQFGDDMKIVTGYGHIFNISDTTAGGVKYDSSIGRELYDILFLPDRMASLENTGTQFVDSTSLVVRSRTTPYGILATVAEFEGEKGVQLISTQSGLTAITKDGANLVHIRQYSTAQLRSAAKGGLVSREDGTEGLRGFHIPLE